ncbi:MAG: hypothetical protein OXI97_11440 [Acidimicrobiaceae bacterium]|nr:hypothetical protein [Acidimicrobiaceae bacterium]
MRLLKPAARLAAVAVLAAGLVAVASPAAQAQSECAEYEQQVRSLTQQIRQSPTDDSLRDQRRLAQVALAACVDDDATAAAIDWCRALMIRTGLTITDTNNCAGSQWPRVAGAVSTGGDQDRFNAAYDRALEQATAAAGASTDAFTGGRYSAGFRVTGQSQNRDGTTSSDCYVVIQTITYSPHNPGENDRWTATQMSDGSWQRVFTDVGHC